jgi:hypothetical protein
MEITEKPPVLCENMKALIRTKCFESLRSYVSPVPIQWLLRPEEDAEAGEPDKENEDISTKKMHLDKFLSSVEFSMKTNEEQREVIHKMFSMNEEDIAEIAKQTIGQFRNPIYRQYRRFRLTASNFGFILAAVKRNSFPPSFWHRILSEDDLGGVSTIEILITDSVIMCINNNFLLQTYRLRLLNGADKMKIQHSSW